MELVALLIVIFVGLLALVVLGKLFSWALRNNNSAILLLVIAPILAYIAYNI
jgi:hypothetical protein